MKNQRKTLKSQLSNAEVEEGKSVANLMNVVKLTEEISSGNNHAKSKFLASQTMNVHVKSNANLRKSSSMDAISASGSDSSSGRYTPQENGAKNIISQLECGNLLSPLSSSDSPRDPVIRSANHRSTISAPHGSLDGLSSSSGEALLGEGSHESDNPVEKLNTDFIGVTRQLEVSKLELQTLRKQVVKESRRGHDLARELQSMKEERDALERECLELKASKKRAADEEHVSTKLQFGGKDPWSMLEETEQELNHVKKMNANLQLQLKKTQESNSELILAVREMEELLQQKSKEFFSCGRISTAIKPDIMEELEEINHKVGIPQGQNSEIQTDLLETSTDEGCAMSLADQKISNLTTELELYKDREEIEIQMEQLALDYEILKQENHDISTKLAQIQLRENLGMQFEFSSNFASISDLESHIESLEKEIERQAEAFRADLEIISRAKVEEEKRSILAEEALRKIKLHNYNTAEQLQEEFKMLTAQMSSSFYMNEKLVMQTLKESSELQMQKCNLEAMLEKTNQELESVRHQHHIKSQQLLSLIDFKTNEVDSLVLELKKRREELEKQRMAEEERRRDSAKQIEQLTAEVENLSRKSDHLSEQIKLKEGMMEEMEQVKASVPENGVFRMEKSVLGEEFFAVKIENDAIIRAQSDGLKHSMNEDELDKENLRKQVVTLGGGLLQKEAGIIFSTEKSLKEHNAKVINSDGLINSSTRSKIYKSRLLHSEDTRSNEAYTLNHIKEDKTKMMDAESIEVALVISNNGDGRSIPCACEEQKTAKVLVEMAELKEQHQLMEAELKDMQERYSEMSLKFAEVEGERQLLVIKIRGLKNALKS
ncbi:hypothetical protein KSP39_PZI009830 [Platanthera zijinensis]|uniref:Uncharacterized protein n=1 Tax=Platanthera zijinensis TaxID=2320716 RepID=A0AAP0G737_9ASPA